MEYEPNILGADDMGTVRALQTQMTWVKNLGKCHAFHNDMALEEVQLEKEGTY